jgi:hypothetical protein
MSDIENSNGPDSVSVRKTLEHFTQKENRKAVIFQEMETEQQATDEKTAKLRALRLAKEAADAKAAAGSADAKPVPKKRRAKVIHTH